jgi:hypothetical protein
LVSVPAPTRECEPFAVSEADDPGAVDLDLGELPHDLKDRRPDSAAGP